MILMNILLFQEQLLTVTTKIMTSLQKQDQSVQELSSKMDKNFAGLTEKLDSYIGEQNQFRQKKSQVEQAFFSGLQSRNSNLESIFDQDKEATEQYLKSSTIMNQQIMVRIYYYSDSSLEFTLSIKNTLYFPYIIEKK